MRIIFAPQRNDAPLSIEKSGNRLLINDELFNFDALEPGDIIPARVVPCSWLDDWPIEHRDGHVTVTIRLPYGPNAEAWQTHAETITVDADGPVDIPVNTTVSREEEPVAGGVLRRTTMRRWHHPDQVETLFIPLEVADVEP